MTRRMICGGLAGMIAKTVTNPLDRIRMLRQTGEHGMSAGGSSGSSGGGGGASVRKLYEGILRNEGILGLWAGNGANLLRVFPAKAVVFSSNDLFQGILRKFSETPSDQKLNPSWSFLAGGMAGMTATACTYPLDLARGRISGKLETGTKKQYKGIIRTMVLTVKDEGFWALFKGITPTLLGAMPYEGIKFGTVGILELLFPSDEISPTRKMIFGGAGGVMAGILTYPNDTVRRLLQLQGSRGTVTEFNGYWDCVRKTYHTYGIQRFYYGVTINIIRMAPNAAVQFGSYELLKKLTAGYV